MSGGLQLDGVSVSRQGSPIVRDVTLEVPEGEITVLLGANGAGKTTLLEAISGVIPTTSGAIRLAGREIQTASRPERSNAGLGHVEQGRNVFAELTVAENIEVAASGKEGVERALELFPELRPRLGIAAGSLSGGEQQMLVIARALARDPRVLLLDEMSLGLAPVIVQRLLPVVRRLADSGVGVLLVEQFADLALGVGDNAYVLGRGSVILEGTANELGAHPERVRDAYLGVSGASATG